MNLMKLSLEQQSIIREIRDHHVQVTAVAGCGKTTTNLFLAQHNKDLNILLLTYNASLRIETNLKIAEYGLDNIQVHTFHSFAFKFYKECFNDYGIFEILEYQLAPISEYADSLNFDIIILDEMQDMTLLYFRFICKIYHDNKAKNPRFCILGDPHQTIYQYNGSDSQYFENFVRLFEYRDWKKYKLQSTFRCTNSVSDFLNKIMLQHDRIFTSKDGPLVKYLMCDTYEDDIFREISFYLSIGYKVDDIFILAPSIKTASSPVRRLSEKFSFHNYPVFVSYSDEDKPNERVLRNKLVFLSFHQSKGLERKVVVVLGFDNSYFLYYKKGNDPLVCPNELYVAVTRSSERLIVVHDVKHDFLPFLDVDAIPTKTNFVKKDLKKKRVYSKDPSGVTGSGSGSGALNDDSLYSPKKAHQTERLTVPKAERAHLPETRFESNKLCSPLANETSDQFSVEGTEPRNINISATSSSSLENKKSSESKGDKIDHTFVSVNLRTTSQELSFQTIFNISVSNLLKKLSFEDIHQILLTLDIQKICSRKKKTRIELPNIILIDKSHFQTFAPGSTNSSTSNNIPRNGAENECIYENVSDINSLVIFSLFEYLVTKKSFLTQNSSFDLKARIIENAECAECAEKKDATKQSGTKSDYISASGSIIDKKNLDLTTQLCVERLCIRNNYIFKLYQLKSFDWLDAKMMDDCMYRLLSLGVSKDAEFEKEIKIFDSRNNILLCGRLDCMDANKRIIWEFKCVGKIDYLHFLQLALYYYIMNEQDMTLSNSDFSYYLYNVPDDDWYEMKVHDKQGLLCIVRRILLECRQNYENPTSNEKSRFDFSNMTLYSQHTKE